MTKPVIRPAEGYEAKLRAAMRQIRKAVKEVKEGTYAF